MTQQDDKRSKSPADRFRNILSDNPTKDAGSTGRTYPKRTLSPNLNLPKLNQQNYALVPVSEPPGAPPPVSSRKRPTAGTFLPAFWTIASSVSLLFNVVLLIAVVSLLRSVGSLNVTSVGSGVLGGLYGNFERMDQAHIRTSIPVQTNIPLDLTVPVQTTTAITLANDVSIPGAHVRINTALFNIDAPANVTLPAGTSMNVVLNFTLPVQSQVPVSFNVPVDIPIQDTELHPAINGLQDTLRPLYCILSPSAQSLTGQRVCR